MQVTQELTDLGLNQSAINGILSLTEIESVEHLEQLLGADNEAVHEIKSLFALADSAGCSSYLEFDPSVVRGLAYYTGETHALQALLCNCLICLLYKSDTGGFQLQPIYTISSASLGSQMMLKWT